MNIQGLGYISAGNNHYLNLITNGGSDAVVMQSKFIRPVTVLLSVITVAKTASLQYSLSLISDVEDDTAVWHDVVDVHDVIGEAGTSFDSPINFIRVIADKATSWRLEVLT